MNFPILILCVILFPPSVYPQTLEPKQLDQNLRHHEWVKVPSNGRDIHSFIAYPEKSRPTLAVIVIHENRGLTDWVRSFTDQLASEGYLAIAPDLLSGFDADHNRTGDFKSPDDAREAIYDLDPDQTTKDLLAVQRFVSKLPSSNGITVVMGFCWGGSQSFRFATNAPDLSAAFVFYGSSPTEDEAIGRISAPVYGFYGKNDHRINATISDTKERMGKYGKTYHIEIYEGAGHAFMRDGDDSKGTLENKKARNEAWMKIKKVLSHIQ